MQNSFKKITVLYDGDCHFCLRWVRYWKSLLPRRVAWFYRYQKALKQFPKLSEADCQKSIQLIEASGNIYSGAEAVLRLLCQRFPYRCLYFFYRQSKYFAYFSEKIYAYIAKHRIFFNRFLNPPKRITYHYSASIFLRMLGLIWFVAFFSLGTQVLGLYGEKGILPIKEFLSLIEQNIGSERFLRFPTLFWLSSSDFVIRFVCFVGVFAGIFVVLNRGVIFFLAVAWMSYLSFVSVGRDFMSFQWDILLLEVGFLAIFFLKKRNSGLSKPGFCFSNKVIFLFRLLLFRLMFLSGFVKLASGDESWRRLQALSFHYETQPLPNPLSWYFHHLPVIFHEISTVVVLIIELILPFLIFGPRSAKRFSGVVFILFQVLIILSGNYTFFNFLTIALCFFLIDDAYLGSWSKKKFKKNASLQNRSGSKGVSFYLWEKIKGFFFVSFILLNGLVLMKPFHFSNRILSTLDAKTMILKPFYLVNSYGLFAVMTQKRNELIIEASMDNQNWKPYEFKYKPGDVNRVPPWIAPLQPRLDWQMWFAALTNIYRNPWFTHFLELLVNQEPEIMKMMAVIPYSDKPQYLRVQLYEYHFSDRIGHKKGVIWTRNLKGSYLRAMKISQ